MVNPWEEEEAMFREYNEALYNLASLVECNYTTLEEILKDLSYTIEEGETPCTY